MPRSDGWGAAVQRVGNALVELLRAELGELGSDLRDSRRKLVRILLLGGAAAFLAFWLLAVLLYGAIETAALWLPRWGAALAVAGVIALTIAILALLLRSTARRLDSPVRTVQRRIENHLLWWNDTLGGAPGGGSLDAGSDDEDWAEAGQRPSRSQDE